MNQYKTLVLLLMLTTISHTYPLVENSTNEYLPTCNKSCRNSTVVLYDRDVEVLKQLMGFVNDLMEQRMNKDTKENAKEKEITTTTRATTKDKETSEENYIDSAISPANKGPSNADLNPTKSQETTDLSNLLNLDKPTLPFTLQNINNLKDKTLYPFKEYSDSSKSLDNLSQSTSEDKKDSNSNETYEFQASNSLEDKNGSPASLQGKDGKNEIFSSNTDYKTAQSSNINENVIHPSKYFEHHRSFQSNFNGNPKAFPRPFKGQRFETPLDVTEKYSLSTKEQKNPLIKEKTTASDRANPVSSSHPNGSFSHYNFNSKPQPFQKTSMREEQSLTSSTDNGILKHSAQENSGTISSQSGRVLPLKESKYSFHSHTSKQQISSQKNSLNTFKNNEISKRNPSESKDHSLPLNSRRESLTKQPSNQASSKSNDKNDQDSLKLKPASSTSQRSTENSLQYTSKPESRSVSENNSPQSHKQQPDLIYDPSKKENVHQSSTPPQSKKSSLPTNHSSSRGSLNFGKRSNMNDIPQDIDEQQTAADSSALFSHTSNIPYITYLDNQKRSFPSNHGPNFHPNSLNLAHKHSPLKASGIMSPFPRENYQNLMHPESFDPFKYIPSNNSPYFNPLDHVFETHKRSPSHNTINSPSPGSVDAVLTIPPYIRDIIKNHLNSQSQEVQDKFKPEMHSKQTPFISKDLDNLDNPEISPAIRELIKNHLNSRLTNADLTPKLHISKNIPPTNPNPGFDLQQLTIDDTTDTQLQQEISPYMREMIRNRINSSLKDYFNNPKGEMDSKLDIEQKNGNTPEIKPNPKTEIDGTNLEISPFIRDIIRNQLNDQMQNEITKHLHETKKLSTTEKYMEGEETSGSKVKSPTTRKMFANNEGIKNDTAISIASKTNSIITPSTNYPSILPEFIKQLVERGVLTNADSPETFKRFSANSFSPTSTTPETSTTSSHSFSPVNSIETSSVTLSPFVKKLLSKKSKSNDHYQYKIPIFDLGSFKPQQFSSTTTSAPSTVKNIWDEISQKQENKRAITTPTNTTENPPKKRLCFKTFCFKFQEDKGMYV